MGEIGISRQEFMFELKLWEINAIVEGYRRRAYTTWEAARWQTYCIVCAMGAKNIYSPQDIMKFPWETEDKSVQAEEVSEEEVKEMQREIDEINQQLKDAKNRQDNNPLQ